LRLLEIENPLRQIIHQFIADTYGIRKGLPDVQVLDRKQWAEKFPGMVGVSPALFHVRQNALYFVEVPPNPYDVAHEILHWYQAQEIGAENYLQEIKNPETRERYEKAADDVAGTFEHRLSTEFRRYGIIKEPAERARR